MPPEGFADNEGPTIDVTRALITQHQAASPTNNSAETHALYEHLSYLMNRVEPDDQRQVSIQGTGATMPLTTRSQRGTANRGQESQRGNTNRGRGSQRRTANRGRGGQSDRGIGRRREEREDRRRAEQREEDLRALFELDEGSQPALRSKINELKRFKEAISPMIDGDLDAELLRLERKLQRLWGLRQQINGPLNVDDSSRNSDSSMLSPHDSDISANLGRTARIDDPSNSRRATQPPVQQASAQQVSTSGGQGRAQENLVPSIVAPNPEANDRRTLRSGQATNRTTSTSGRQGRAQENNVASTETPDRVANSPRTLHQDVEASPNGQATTRNPSISGRHGTAQDDPVPSIENPSPVINNPQASYPNLEASASRQAGTRTTPLTTRNTPGLRQSPLSGFNPSQSTPAVAETYHWSFDPVGYDDVDMGSDRSPLHSVHDTDPEEYDEQGELLLTRARYQEEMHGTSEIKVVAWRNMGYGKQVVVQYGPNRSARYELMAASAADCVWSTEDPDILDIGRESRGHDALWTKANVQGIGVVAWRVPNDDDDIFSNIDPVKVKRDRRRYAQTIAMIKWSDREWTWETRDTVRRYFSDNPKDGDKVIHRQAKVQEKRYNRYMARVRPEGVAPNTRSEARIAADWPVPRRSVGPATRQNAGSGGSTDTGLVAFLRSWNEVHQRDVNTPLNSLTGQERGEITAAWDAHKAVLLSRSST